MAPKREDAAAQAAAEKVIRLDRQLAVQEAQLVESTKQTVALERIAHALEHVAEGVKWPYKPLERK